MERLKYYREVNDVLDSIEKPKKKERDRATKSERKKLDSLKTKDSFVRKLVSLLFLNNEIVEDHQTVKEMKQATWIFLRAFMHSNMSESFLNQFLAKVIYTADEANSLHIIQLANYISDKRKLLK